jgi:hypothetical protein
MERCTSIVQAVNCLILFYVALTLFAMHGAVHREHTNRALPIYYTFALP